MKNYHVRFTDPEGSEKTQLFQATSAGSAFVKCQKLNPGSTMLGAMAYGAKMGEGFTRYPSVPVQRDPVPDPHPPRPLKPSDKSCVFPFYDSCLRP